MQMHKLRAAFDAAVKKGAILENFGNDLLFAEYLPGGVMINKWIVIKDDNSIEFNIVVTTDDASGCSIGSIEVPLSETQAVEIIAHLSLQSNSLAELGYAQARLKQFI
jgi:hypothetical protein